MCEDNRQGKGTCPRLSVVILSWKRKGKKMEGVNFLKWEATLTQLLDSRPPPMWSGFKFRTRRPIVGLVCWLILGRKVFPGTPVFPSQVKRKFHLICSLHLIQFYFKYSWDSSKVTLITIIIIIIIVIIIIIIILVIIIMIGFISFNYYYYYYYYYIVYQFHFCSGCIRVCTIHLGNVTVM